MVQKLRIENKLLKEPNLKNQMGLKVKQKMSALKKAGFKGKLRRYDVLNYLREELRTSSTHGVSYIVNTELHWFERFYWVIWFAICVCIMLTLLIWQFERFIETPTVMSVEMDYFDWNMTYPAITLCPLFKTDKQVWEKVLQENNKTMAMFIFAIMSSGMRSLEKLKLDTPKGNATVDVKDYAAFSAKHFKRFDLESLTTSNNWPVTVEPTMTELGMCHVINSNVAKYHNPLKWMKNMSTSSYVRNNVLLSVHDRDFFIQIINYTDVFEIFIHSPDDIILSTSPSYLQGDIGFLSFGVNVFSSKISEELRRFPRRIRKCRLINEPSSKRYPIYSYNHCMMECRIKMIKTLCGCVPHFYKPLDNERICSLEQLKCVLKYKNEFTSLSASDKILRKFGSAKTLPKSPRDCGCLSSCETDSYSKDYESFVGQQPFSRLRIGITAFPKVRVERNIIFSYYDAILKTGGVVNLCIGASILSIVESIIRMLKVLILLIKTRKNGH